MKSVSRLFRDWIFSNSLIVIFLLLAGSMLVLTPEEQKFCGHCVTFVFLAVPALIFILQDFLISEENVKEQYAGNIPDERVDGIVVSGHEGVLESYRKMS